MRKSVFYDRVRKIQTSTFVLTRANNKKLGKSLWKYDKRPNPTLALKVRCAAQLEREIWAASGGRRVRRPDLIRFAVMVVITVLHMVMVGLVHERIGGAQYRRRSGHVRMVLLRVMLLVVLQLADNAHAGDAAAAAHAADH